MIITIIKGILGTISLIITLILFSLMLTPNLRRLVFRSIFFIIILIIGLFIDSILIPGKNVGKILAGIGILFLISSKKKKDNNWR